MLPYGIAPQVPHLPDLRRQDDDLDLVAIAPVQELVTLHGAVPEGLRSLDGLGQVLGQGQPHLLLHLGQPLVDSRVLDGRHGAVEENLFALGRGDTYSKVLQEDIKGRYHRKILSKDIIERYHRKIL